jgi:hypothetical protein
MTDPDHLNSRIKRELEQSLLDKDVEQQLINARHLALQPREPGIWQRYRIPVLALASICIIAISLVLLNPVQKSATPDSFEAFEVITTAEELEMIENLEFYLWLDEQDMDKA